MMWVLLLIVSAWGVISSMLAYHLGHSEGWLKCHNDHTLPAFDGWKRSEELTEAALQGWQRTLETWERWDA